MNDQGWVRMFARVMLGTMFLTIGFYKCFELTPIRHAEGGFVGPYAETWIPYILLLGLGLSIPIVELLAGVLLVIGYRTREASIVVGFILLIVTYGHLLLEPLYSITDHILPRALLMFAVLLLPQASDRFSIDQFLAARRS